MGHYLYNPKIDKHVHDYPQARSQVAEDAIWQCDCGKNFIAHIDSDYRESWVTWQEINNAETANLLDKFAALGHTVHGR